MKKPIPDEHVVLKTTFEGLIQKCLAVATDPVSLIFWIKVHFISVNGQEKGEFFHSFINSKQGGSLTMLTSALKLSTTNSESRRWGSRLWFLPLLTTSCLFTSLLRFSPSSLQLSPAIVGGLHNIARSIETRSYTEGLNIHTHIVSNSNFSETSAFMPVLKVVLTQANKLGV